MMHKMNLITVRNVPPVLAHIILKTARKRRISVNKAVIALLEEHFGENKKPVFHHDLDHLAGVWSRAQAKVFERTLTSQRTIDPDLWK